MGATSYLTSVAVKFAIHTINVMHTSMPHCDERKKVDIFLHDLKTHCHDWCTTDSHIDFYIAAYE